MDGLHQQLLSLIEAAVASGVGVDEIEHELLDPAGLSRDEHDAAWLYAFGRSDYPHRRTVPIIAA